MPKKTFVNGQILTDGDLNDFLMNQSVMVFDSSANRSTAIGTAIEGMVTYLKDTNDLEAFNGSAWTKVSYIPPLTTSALTSYTLTSADANTYLQMTSAGTVTVDSSTGFTPGQQVQILADGTALRVNASGVTLAGAGATAAAFTIGEQYTALSIINVATNTYRIIGDVSAV